MTRPRVSTVVITLNEEDRLRACLESVAWTDELIVVDAESEDKTVHIAREFTEHVVVRPWGGFAAQKNFAIAQAAGDWILSLDADEEVSPALRAEILETLEGRPTYAGFAMPRQNIFWGQWIRHGGLYPDWQVRLFKRGQGIFGERAVHESVRIEGAVGRLRGVILHRSYRDLSDFLVRAERYSSLAADEWIRSGRPVRTSDLVFRPFGRFFSMYVLRRGFLDGSRGFLLAILYAYYVFMRSAKAWEKAKFAGSRR